MQETQIKRVIDAGITSIYLEEPEFGCVADIAKLLNPNGRNIIISPGELSTNLPKTHTFPTN